ncbi:MAG: hypothetical protein GXP25_19375 [Planctomycetes bacterium]|nr:hypothetical protein [Planctomycetota bacterium]
MKPRCFASLFIVPLAISCPGVGTACTILLVTQGATTVGSLIVSHSGDDELGDQRVLFAPAADHKPGAKRPVYKDSFVCPRYAGKSRGPGDDTPGLPPTKPLGDIDPVAHTYAYFDGNYGIDNANRVVVGPGRHAYCQIGRRVREYAQDCPGGGLPGVVA